MASTITNHKSKTRTIAFFLDGRERKFIRLGKTTLKEAATVRANVEDLVTAWKLGRTPSPATADWLAGLSDTIRRRIENTGLIEPRERTETPTLTAWLDRYIGGRADIKPRTRGNYDQARKCLEAFFGPATPLDEITQGACQDFGVWLRTERGLGEGTARRRTKRCRQFFAAAVARKILAENPFDGIKCGNYASDRFYFVSRAETAAVLDACPDAEWRLIVALARFGGLRVPSELLPLEWADINWERARFTVTSPKTAGHDGKASRIVPIFPEVLPYLRDAFELAEPGQRHVITRYRDSNANLRTQLLRIIRRAGLEPWPKLFVNLRSTRATELAEAFPAHVAAAWLGHSPEIARRHYLQVTDGHFQRATAGDGKAHQKAHHFPAKSASESAPERSAPNRNAPHRERSSGRKPRPDRALCDGVRKDAGRCVSTDPQANTPTGSRTPVSRMRT